MKMNLQDWINKNKPLSSFLNCDCMEFMATVPDKFFELAIVDPPYGIGKFTCDAHTDKNGNRIKNIKTYSDNYDWNDSVLNYKYFIELKRISKNRIIWGANYYNCFENGNGALVWNKGEMAKTISQCEIASLSFQKKVDYIHIEWQAGFFRTIKEGIPIHPCQKPIQLYQWLLLHYAKKGDKIFDSHVGSASSLIACHLEGFEYIGCELDPDYYKEAKQRLGAYTAQRSLF